MKVAGISFEAHDSGEMCVGGSRNLWQNAGEHHAPLLHKFAMGWNRIDSRQDRIACIKDKIGARCEK